MRDETTCPICDFGHIPADSGRCPQCDADLECFRVIDSLPDDLAAEDRSDRDKSRDKERPVLLHGLVLGTMGLLVIGFSVVLYSFEQLESRVTKQQTRLTEMETGRRVRQARRSPEPLVRDTAPARPPSDIPSAAPTRDPVTLPDTPAQPVPSKPAAPDTSDGDEEAFFIYQLKKGDTLWSVAKQFYRDGDLYPVLLLHNPDLNIYRTAPGLRLKILKNKKSARAVFEQNTETDRNEIYWRYTVRQGDTMQSLAARFYGPRASTERITDLNPGAAIAAGNSIRIVLE